VLRVNTPQSRARTWETDTSKNLEALAKRGNSVSGETVATAAQACALLAISNRLEALHNLLDEKLTR
jgi:hypothetical protein